MLVEVKKYNIGFIKRRPNKQEYMASCGCGTITFLGSLGWREIERVQVSVTCKNPDCKNENFMNLTKSNRGIYPYIEVIEKSRKGFKVKRINLSVFHD